MTPVAGRLSDMYGKKKMLLLIVGIYTIGIRTAAISTNFIVMIIARIMQGIGASMFPIAFGIIRDKFEPEKLAVAQGIFSSMFSAGAVIGVAIGGNIIINFGWHADTIISSLADAFCCRFGFRSVDLLLSVLFKILYF
jgi:MFS family permease